MHDFSEFMPGQQGQSWLRLQGTLKQLLYEQILWVPEFPPYLTCCHAPPGDACTARLPGTQRKRM